MANVGFKLGSQATANLMLTNPENYDVQAGHFYLTSDTHRLYIGALPTTTAADGTVTTKLDASPRLFPLNEGIVTVSDLNHLPVFTAGTPEELAAIGTFYYVEDGNILCIYGGTQGGNGWIQVNANTDTNIEGITYNLSTGGENKAVITLGLKDSQGKVIEDKISITVKGGLTSNIVGDDLEITGDTYTLLLEPADETNTKFNIGLRSSNTENDTNVVLEAGDGVSLEQSGNQLKISAEEANQITEVSVEKGYVPASADKEGFRVSLKTKKGAVLESSNFNPKIKYGINETDTVPFKDGVAVLEAYTAAEIQKILRELNAMHYMGTIGIGGSAAQQIVTYGNDELKIMKADNTELQVKIGDMFIVNQTIDNPLQVGANYPTGTILICNSKSGLENTTTGYIDSNQLYLESIESTLDSDTTYTLAKNSTGDGVILTTKNSGDYGELKLTTPGEEPGDSGILLSYNWTGSSDRPIGNISIQHAGIETKVESIQETVRQEGGKEFTIPVVKELKTDGLGHITEVLVQNYVVKDTLTHIKSIENTTHAYTENSVNVGVIRVKATTRTDEGAEKSAEDCVTIVSDTLAIGIDNTHASIQNGGTAEAGISINMVWGEF